MNRLVKLLNGNPAMHVIFQDALDRINKGEELAPAQRIVCNEVLTRAEARISQLELENQAKLKDQQVVPLSLELAELQEAAALLKKGLKQG